MKSRILCAWMIAMLLISTTAIGEIVEYGTKELSDIVSASVSHGESPEYFDEDGDIGTYTTESGWFSWYLEACAYAWASVVVEDGTASALCIAYADTDCPFGDDISAYKTYYFTSTATDGGGDGTYTDAGYDEISAYSGAYADFVVIAAASIEEGSWSSAACMAYAYADAYIMEE